VKYAAMTMDGPTSCCRELAGLGSLHDAAKLSKEQFRLTSSHSPSSKTDGVSNAGNKQSSCTMLGPGSLPLAHLDSRASGICQISTGKVGMVVKANGRMAQGREFTATGMSEGVVAGWVEA